MSSKLKTSVLALGLMGVLGSGLAVAQTAPVAPEAGDDAPAATAPDAAAPAPAAQVQIPELLQDDAFSNVESRPGPRGGLFVEGSITESGKDFDAIVSGDGELMGMRTAEGSALPQALIDELLPEAARSNPVLSEITELNSIGSRDGSVMVGGQDASGDKVRIGFDDEGELMRFERGEQGKRGFGKGGDRGSRDHRGERDEKGPRGDHGDRAERGDHGDKGRMGPREGGPAEGMPRDAGPRPDAQREGGTNGGQPGQPTAPVDEAAIRSAVEAAGYSELGDVSPTPRGIAIEALNPQAEEVLVIVTPEGEVVRETAR